MKQFATLILGTFAATAAQADCTPQQGAPCAFVSGNAITVKISVPPEVKCAYLEYKGPQARVPTRTGIAPRSPISTASFPAATSGRYDYSVYLQVPSRPGSASCPTPFNYPGTASGTIDKP